MTHQQREQLRTAIQILAGTHLWDKNQFVLCNVDSVNADDQTCDCTPIGSDATTQIPAVKLTAEENDGWLLIPKVDSTVVVTYSTRNEPYVTLFSDIDKAVLIAGISTQFNDGSYGGMVKVIELTQKINALENLLNEFIANYNLHTHAGVTSGGSNTATPTPTEGNVIAPITVRSDIENTKITHGT